MAICRFNASFPECALAAFRALQHIPSKMLEVGYGQVPVLYTGIMCIYKHTKQHGELNSHC